jgi:hypothetical protein
MWSNNQGAHRKLYWEIIADNLSKAGWSWGCVSAVDCDGQTIFIADAHHRDDGKRFVVRADEKLTAFLGLESAIRSLKCKTWQRRYSDRLFRARRSQFFEARIVPERIEHGIDPEQRGSQRESCPTSCRSTVSVRARRRFSRSADCREAGPRRAAALVRRNSARPKRREHAVPFLVAAMLTPFRPPTPP